MLALTDLLAYQEFEKSYPPPSDLHIAIPLKRRHLKNINFFLFSNVDGHSVNFSKEQKIFFVLGALQGQIWQSWGRRSMAVDFLSSRILRGGRIEWK